MCPCPWVKDTIMRCGECTLKLRHKLDIINAGAHYKCGVHLICGKHKLRISMRGIEANIHYLGVIYKGQEI